MHRKDASGIAFIIGLDICDVRLSEFGFWVNVEWPCGITAPLTTRECELIGYEI